MQRNQAQPFYEVRQRDKCARKEVTQENRRTPHIPKPEMEVSELTWTKDASYGFKICKWVTWPLGLWPLQCEDYFSKFRMGFALVSQISMTASLLLELIQDCSSTYMKIALVANLSCVIMCIVKMIAIRIHCKKMSMSLASALQDWSFNSNPISYKIMRSYAQTSRIVCIGQMSFACFATSTIILTNLLLQFSDTVNSDSNSSARDLLPLPMTCVYHNISATTYKLVYALQSIQMAHTTIGNCGLDVFFFWLALHACGQLEILKNDVSEFGIVTDKFQLQKYLQVFIKRHLHLINISQQLEDTFSGILMVQLFLNTLIIVLLGIQVIVAIKAGDTALLPKEVVSFIVLMVQLFLYCYAGDYLTVLNRTIGDAVFKCPWYSHPASIGKSLLFIMMRTELQFHITAGKFYNMDMENFKNIFKASMSYISVLMVMLNLDE